MKRKINFEPYRELTRALAQSALQTAVEKVGRRTVARRLGWTEKAVSQVFEGDYDLDTDVMGAVAAAAGYEFRFTVVPIVDSVQFRNSLVTDGYVENLYKLEGEEVLQGIAHINELPYHVLFIRVHDVNGMQEAVKDPENRFKDLGQFNDEALETVKVPGFEGDYVMVIYPFSK